MDKSVARLNIEHYQKLLKTDLDETKRQTILRLLAEEEATLAGLLKDAKSGAAKSNAAKSDGAAAPATDAPGSERSGADQPQSDAAKDPS
ncbi:hypothetical protein HNR60_004226 [Rhodopseudomonas rhenobacensis]|uniref:Uncharacterized protein n=1 Tax=Rhodopseudomonas rhenobacensis TaxID=87461 RepID=A0A7W7Z7I7_9BRAD|nr:hypothetical protein [Rhodopseudomonas rhenobacensis]MBB5049448.1 hypothetical protein [Rhodopseudomonas rhenobacensis]